MGRLSRWHLAAASMAIGLVAPALAGCSSPVNTQGARILHLTIASRYVHHTEAVTLVTPADGGAHRPLLVFLPGAIYHNPTSPAMTCSPPPGRTRSCTGTRSCG